MSSVSNLDDGTPGFGIYVHWPFCAAKCPYCDFNSHVRHRTVDQQAFAEGYAREIAHMAALQPNRPVTSIFFGGGTPSLMDPATVEAILAAIHSHWQVEDGIEITLEANPTSVEADRFAGYRAAGVNRVSLGVQSLRDDQLQFLGRLHTADEAIAAIEIARDLFPRLSFDLIYARPDQQLREWRAELEQAIGLAADHLSLYQLTIEPDTPFYDLHRKGRIKVPDSERAAQLYELTQEVTAAHGLPAYEISNHAKPGCESRHNLTYWRSGTWAGIGPGAHGRLDMNDGRHALSTKRHPESWLDDVQDNGQALTEDDTLTDEELADEMLIMGMRLREGVDLNRYTQTTGIAIDPIRLQDLKGHGMVESWTDDQGRPRLRATPAGWLVLDAVIADLAA
ncbi:MAG: radical SAM family heme chaperone HemW [Pseudomonadota bacterium]